MDLPTQRIGSILIEDRIGQGGMATVYRGHHSTVDRTVAVKVLFAHNEFELWVALGVPDLC